MESEAECPVRSEMPSFGPTKDPIKDALDNYLILCKLMECVTWEERLQLRLINQQWNAAAMDVMISTGIPGVVHISEDSQMESYLNLMTNPSRVKTDMPCASFELSIATLSLKRINEFVDAVGQIVNLKLWGSKEMNEKADRKTVLTYTYSPETGPTGMLHDPLYPNDFGGIEDLQKIIALLSKCHDLETLDLRFENMELGEVDTARLPRAFNSLRTVKVRDLGLFRKVEDTIFGQIMVRAPRLSYLDLETEHRDAYRSRLEKGDGLAMCQLKSILFRPNFPPPSLDLDTEFVIHDTMALREIARRGFSKLRKLKLRLTTFHHRRPVMFDRLPLPDMIRLISTVNEFMLLQGDALEKFSLFINSRAEWDSQMQITFPPIFTKLKTLAIEVNNYVWRTGNQKGLRPIRPFTSEQFPVLKKLWIVTKRIDLGLFSATPTPILSSVESLEIGSQGGPMLKTPLNIIFPKLKTLKFWVLPPLNMVELILKKMSYLEYLHFGYGYDVYGESAAIWKLYTGGAKTLNAKKLLQMFNENKTLEEDLGQSGKGDEGSFGGLANLKDLKTLCLPMRSKLELEAILYLFIRGKFRDLETLEIELQPEMKFDQPMRTIIDGVKLVRKCKWIVNERTPTQVEFQFQN